MFKDIRGFEGLYQINEFGEVKSLSRQKGNVYCKEKIIKHHINNCGYHRVTLCRYGKCKKVFVHRLVYETFKDDIPPRKQIHHIDENKDNNNLSNLMVATAKENNHYSATAKGYKLTQDDVDFIRMNGLTTREIADKYNISLRHALRIIKNERWIS